MSNYWAINSNSQKTNSQKMRAFTLIELLVVIAIIALLLSIVMPALNLVKKKAASAVCLTNVKNLSLAWFSYQEENNSRIVNPNTTNYDADPRVEASGWVCNPIKANGTNCTDQPVTNPVTDEDEIRGIEKGALFVYLKAPDVYHCPADNQRRSFQGDGGKIFRTYSSPRAMKRVKKFTNITTPGLRFNFIEEHEVRNWNQGTWDFYNMPEHDEWEWRDPVGKNHGDSGIIGFCDGHAEVHKWQESYTLDRIDYYFAHVNEISGWGRGGLNDVYTRINAGAPPKEQDRDIAFMVKSWADRGR